MQIITQKQIKQALSQIKFKRIKQLLGRQRLKFSYVEINFYLFVIFTHCEEQKSFKSIYRQLYQDSPDITYQGFMKNINLFSILFRELFGIFNKINSIKASKLINIIDSSLIPEKESKYINNKDWDKNRVTTRIDKKQSNKVRTCGSKGFFVINRNKQITHAELLNINYSDQNYLKERYMLASKFQGILLADRGFSNKAVRDRLKHNKNDIFNYNYQSCRLISPYHYKEKLKLTKKELKLYKRWWLIETLFQGLKHNYSDNKLNLTGKYTKKLKEAKFYCTIIIHNLSTL